MGKMLSVPTGGPESDPSAHIKTLARWYVPITPVLERQQACWPAGVAELVRYWISETRWRVMEEDT